jgi:DNA-binding NarL/FixJ family response regulator
MAATEKRVRILILEDEDLFRDLLRVALSQKQRFEVVGAYAEGQDALHAAEKLKPDVAILDIELGGQLNGIQVGLSLRRQLPKVGILLLSNHGNPQFVYSLPREAMVGWSYLLKKTVSDLGGLERAIEGAASGFVVLDPQIVTGMQPRTGGYVSRLTPRQREILTLIAQGFTNASIAEQLVLSEKSVENQINAIYHQLEIDRESSPMQPRVKAVLIYLQESQAIPTSDGPRL